MAGNLNLTVVSGLVPGVWAVPRAREVKRSPRKYMAARVVVQLMMEEPNMLPFSFKPELNTSLAVRSWVAQQEQWFDVGLTLCPYTAAWVQSKWVGGWMSGG
eukprot:RCo015193